MNDVNDAQSGDGAACDETERAADDLGRVARHVRPPVPSMSVRLTAFHMHHY